MPRGSLPIPTPLYITFAAGLRFHFPIARSRPSGIRSIAPCRISPLRPSEPLCPPQNQVTSACGVVNLPLSCTEVHGEICCSIGYWSYQYGTIGEGFPTHLAVANLLGVGSTTPACHSVPPRLSPTVRALSLDGWATLMACLHWVRLCRVLLGQLVGTPHDGGYTP